MRKHFGVLAAMLAAVLFVAAPSFAQAHGGGFHGGGFHGGPGRGPGPIGRGPGRGPIHGPIHGPVRPVHPGGDFGAWRGHGYHPGYGFGYGLAGWHGWGYRDYVFGWHPWLGYWNGGIYWGPVIVIDLGWQSQWDGTQYVYWDPYEHCWVNQYGQIVGY